MKKRISIFCILCCCLTLTAQIQEKDTISQKTIKVIKKESTTGQHIPDSITLEERFKLFKIGTKEAKELEVDVPIRDFFPIIDNHIKNGNICYIYNRYQEEVIEEYFKNFTPIIIPEYFLLGVLECQKPVLINDIKSDSINKNQENAIVKYLERYIWEHFKIPEAIKEDTRGNVGISSPELLQIISRFYEEDTEQLKPDIFDADEKISSYLLGIYFRRGQKSGNEILSDEIYIYKRSGSSDFYEIDSFCTIDIDRIFSFLRKVCCNNILFSSPYRKNGIPGGKVKIFFEPSLYLKKYFDTIEEEKK